MVDYDTLHGKIIAYGAARFGQGLRMANTSADETPCSRAGDELLSDIVKAVRALYRERGEDL